MEPQTVEIIVTEGPFLDTITRHIEVRVGQQGSAMRTIGDPPSFSGGVVISQQTISPRLMADSFDLALKSSIGILSGVRLMVKAPLTQREIETLYDCSRQLLRYVGDKLRAEMSLSHVDSCVQEMIDRIK